MKHTFFYVVFIFVCCHTACSQKQQEYSKINFSLLIEKTITDDERNMQSNNISKHFFKVWHFYYQKLGRLEVYCFPKNKTLWQEIYKKEGITRSIIHDSLSVLLKSKQLLHHFEVYAIWIDKKYLTFVKDRNQETGVEFMFPYVEDTTVAQQEIYKLTNKGWLLLEKTKKRYKEIPHLESALKPYLSKELMPEYLLKEKE